MLEIQKNLPEIAEFSKVSLGQWVKDADFWRKRGYTEAEIVKMHERIMLPTRATRGSAGYDFKSPCDFMLEPGDSVTIPTGIRAYIEHGWFLGIFPRSSLGFKYGARFANTVPIVDSDYYGAENEGHIFLKLTSPSDSGRRMIVREGDGFAQGIFMQYGVVFGEETTVIRTGGLGSTDSGV